MLEKVLGNLRWLGHDGFCLTHGGKVIYFDPFRLKGTLEPADLILISHEHFDHCSPEDVAKIQKQETVIVTEPLAARKLTGDVRVLAPGEQLEVSGITVEAYPAYNLDKDFHPAANRWLSFVVTVEGVRIFHAGDTDRIPEMKGLEVDIALLPVSGTYVMTAEEAAQAALDINPKVALPMHFDSIVGSRKDAERFRDLLAGKIRVVIPEEAA